jgi:glc operon protein GlcG
MNRHTDPDSQEEIIMRSVVAFGIVLGAVVLLQPAEAGPFGEKKVLTLEIARRIVTAAELEATRNHLAGVVAVVDDGGWPILIERMDHAAYLASVELAPGKARTAALFKKPSQALEDAINHGRVAAVTARGFTEMQGALPIVVDGEVIGAVGASFDTSEHDVQIAQAGLAAVPH